MKRIHDRAKLFAGYSIELFGIALALAAVVFIFTSILIFAVASWIRS